MNPERVPIRHAISGCADCPFARRAPIEDAATDEAHASCTHPDNEERIVASEGEELPEEAPDWCSLQRRGVVVFLAQERRS